MSLRKKNKWFLIVLIVVLGLYVGFRYTFKSHTTTEELKTDYTGNSADFLTKVSSNFNAWNKKAVELSGKVTAKDANGITLNNQIYCQFRNDVNFKMLKENNEVKIKGRIIGYDDLLEELRLDECIIK